MLGSRRSWLVVAVSAILGAAIAVPVSAFAADISSGADSAMGSGERGVVGTDADPAMPMMSDMMGRGGEADAPDGPAMARMHGQMMREHPEMARSCREMMRDHPAMRRAHEEMMERSFPDEGN